MSYDTEILIDTGGTRLAVVEVVGNITSNIGGMYRAVMPGPYPGGGKYSGVGEPEPQGGLPGVSGLKCSDALPIVSKGILEMLRREDEMRDMEPDNGWGSYEGALRYLRRLKDACVRHPRGLVAVDS